MARVLIVGCGYTGTRIAALHRDRGDAVTATSRSTPLDISGTEAQLLDLDAARLPALPLVDRVYYTIPPPPTGIADTRLARLLERLPAPRVVVYLGTTAVYGNRAGKRVTEETSLAPAGDRARRRADAEEQVRGWCHAHGCAAAILRVAGIYGPGRLPLGRLRSGKPVPDPAQTGPGNRIHVDDLAAAAVAVGDWTDASAEAGTWNISDGNPLSVAEFNDLVADAAGLPRPRRVPLESPEISEGLRSFLRDSRQVDSSKLLALKGFDLVYPHPAAGIRASLPK